MPTADQHSDSGISDEYMTSFAIAKEALMHIANSKTPPTPAVYEVWYRFVEGGNEAINDQLKHAVNVAKSVSKSQLEELRRQFLDESDSAQLN